MAGINRKVLLGIAGAFLLLGLVRLFINSNPYFYCFAQIYCSVVVLIWTVSVHKRITNRRLRLLLLSTSALLLFSLLLQVCRYMLFSGVVVVCRYCWYFYYLPMTAAPMIFLAVSLLIRHPADWRLPLWFWVLTCAASVLVLGVLTNDLHQQFHFFPGPVWTDDGSEKSRWLYHVVTIFQYLLYFVGFGILFYKSRATAGRLRLLPLVPLMIAVVYFVLYPLDLDRKLVGFRVLNVGEMLVFCLIGGLEICIQTGMIPANTDYERLFSLAAFPAAILDHEGNLYDTTAGAEYPFPDREGLQRMTHPIRGGRIEWTVDVEGLTRLNRELSEAAQQLEARNAYLAAQTQVRAEKTELEARSRIYDDVVRATRSQSEQIDGLLRAREPDFNTRLRRIAVLSAFIKRRSNMVLLTQEDRLPFEELTLAVKESLTYVRLCGVRAASFSTGEGSFPARVITDVYEQIERIVEDCLDSLKDLMVYLDGGDRGLTVRLLVRTDQLCLQTDDAPLDLPGWTRRVSVSKTEDDLILVFTYAEGGEAP